MKNTLMVKSSREFTRTIKRGKSSSDNYILIFIYPNHLKTNKIGISIGKKVGNSVVRNKVKRLIKENYRLIEEDLKTGYDIIFIPREACKDADFWNIKKSILKSLKKLDILCKEVIK